MTRHESRTANATGALPRLVVITLFLVHTSGPASAHHNAGHDAEQFVAQSRREVAKLLENPEAPRGPGRPDLPHCNPTQNDPWCLVFGWCVGPWTPTDADTEPVAWKANEREGYGVAIHHHPYAWHGTFAAGAAYHDSSNGCLVFA